jgi:ABC-type Co2+ transport system permease subunit
MIIYYIEGNEMNEFDKRHLVKQFGILNMVMGCNIAFILVTLIVAKFWLSIAFAIITAIIVKYVNRKGRKILKSME